MTLLGALLVTAHPVIVVDPVEKKRKKALEIGADAVVDPAEGDVAKQIQKITGSDGAQFVFEVSGTTKGFEQAVQSTSRGGMMVAIGFRADRNKPEFRRRSSSTVTARCAAHS